MDKLKGLLAILSEAHGQSGREEEVRAIIANEARKHASKIETDGLGNLYVEVEGRDERPKVMVAAHMDEVGLIVKHVEERGFLRFETVGSIDPRILPGQRVVVMGSKPYLGVIGAKPPHMQTQEELKKSPELVDLYIDLGLTSREEVTTLGIDVGATASFDVAFREMGVGSMVVGKALDDRAGCAAALLIMESLAKERPTASTVFAFTVQEEVGLRGAAVAANRTEPDSALVFETTIAADHPGVEPRERVTEIGRGPAIRVMDATMITQRPILDYMKRKADSLGIPYQMQLYLKGGTDAGRIHLSGRGIPTGVLSTPCRYLHSPSLILSLKDLENLVKLAEATIRGIERRDQFTLAL